jgi:hypothetical protein
MNGWWPTWVAFTSQSISQQSRYSGRFVRASSAVAKGPPVIVTIDDFPQPVAKVAKVWDHWKS